MEGRYNTRSPAVKRLMREAQELSEPTDQYYAQPLEDNLFEWHFTIRGPADSDFQNGVYHGRIILPVDYPMKPPSIIWLTPNGRFETNKKICLSISGHHPESWQPSWSIRTALLAIIGFMPTRPGGAIGSLDYTPDERKVLAKKSQDWKCQACGSIHQILLERKDKQPQASQEAKDLAAQIQFQGEKPKSKDVEKSATSAPAATLPSSAAAPLTTTTTTTAVTETLQQPQHQNQHPQMLPQPPGFPQWNFPPAVSTVAPGTGFPPFVAWPGLPAATPPGADAAGGAYAMIPRFPYPPSQQPFGNFPMQFFPPGFAPVVPPQSVGMFPVPPVFHQSVPQAMAGTEAPETPSQCNEASSMNTTTPDGAAIESMVNQHQTPPASAQSAPQKSQTVDSPTGDEGLDNAAVCEPCPSSLPREAQGGATADADCSLDDDTTSPLSSTDRDAVISEASLCREEGIDTEQSELDLPRDKLDGDDESSRGDAPPLDFSEGEQRSSYFERSVSSSVPDLERQAKSLPKGLRHRQSATAAVPTTEVGEDAGQGAEAASQSGRQRIEAASGDTPPRLMRQPRAFAEARLAHRNAIARSTQPRAPSQYDGSVFAMLVLGVATALILLNRLVRMVDWSFIL